MAATADMMEQEEAMAAGPIPLSQLEVSHTLTWLMARDAVDYQLATSRNSWKQAITPSRVSLTRKVPATTWLT